MCKAIEYLDLFFLATRGAPQRNQGRQGEEGVDTEASQLSHIHTYCRLTHVRET